jgi:hypothetical protein
MKNGRNSYQCCKYEFEYITFTQKTLEQRTMQETDNAEIRQIGKHNINHVGINTAEEIYIGNIQSKEGRIREKEWT